jgi:hypothetical protein
MNLLNALKLTALMTAGTAYGAFAQQKPQVEKKKPQTEIKSVVKGDTTSTYESKRDSLDRLIMERKTKSMWREEEKNSGKTVEVPELPKLPAAKTPQRELTDEEKFKLRRSKQTDEQNRAEDSLMQVPGYPERMWKAYAEQKKKAQADKDQKRLKELEDQTAYLLQHIAMLQQALQTATDSLKMKNLQRVDSVETTNYVYQGTPEITEERPMTIGVGIGEYRVMGPKFDENVPQLGPIDNEYSLVDKPVKFLFIDVLSPSFGKKGIGKALYAHARGEFYEDGVIEGHIEDEINDGLLYRYKTSQRDALNVYQLGFTWRPMIGKGLVRVEPSLNVGGQYQKTPKFDIEDGYKMTRSQEQTVKQNSLSMYADAGIDICVYLVDNEKLEDNRKKKTAVLFFLGAHGSKSTQSMSPRNPFSGQGYGVGEDQWALRFQAGFAIKP